MTGRPGICRYGFDGSLKKKHLALVLQDPSESVFWAGFKGLFIPPEQVFGALGLCDL